ncbi:histidinol-phosphate transaminase [uncultured Ruegeria sp.]|uniref:pyridoxal phosphate-dependent aminotransferase n=1 Tax=uncultured Ruegeria sp. TaxID=259304 RepID=UPI0026356374|nr:histidinol-phosphate transaminase [uncultured Ruegeria sp.]
MRAANETAAKIPLYLDPDWLSLRVAIAQIYDFEPDRILCGAGSMELIGCLIRAFAGPEDRILGGEYGYAYVSSASAQVEADYVTAREADLSVSVDEVLAAVTDRTRIVFICHPGSPTGTPIKNSDILRLRHHLQRNIMLVVDQAYAELSDSGQDPAEIFALVQRGDTVALRTFSKAYGLAGARVGWGYFPHGTAAEIRKILIPNNIPAPSQAMADAAMLDQKHMAEIIQKTTVIRDRFAADCRKLGLDVPQSHTNFVLLRFATAQQMQVADNALRADGLMMRPMGGYWLHNCLHATICSDEIMRNALAVLKGVLS